ncbi:N6-mAMP deaminase (AtMAPDA) (Adenosine deaminase-like protein), partial [Durusdinium trenchii]
ITQEKLLPGCMFQGEPTCWAVLKRESLEAGRVDLLVMTWTSAERIELLERRGQGGSFQPFNFHGDLSNALQKCFGYFAKVASVVVDLETLKECTLHVLDSFAAENCIYLELRTSPKQFKVVNGEEHLTTKLQYLETVRAAIDEFHAQAMQRYGFVMEVKVLLSVDRGKVTSKDSALAQIDDVLKLQKEHADLVVGVDVCGDPHQPTVVPHLLPALQERKNEFQKLPITFHTSEIVDDEESKLIIDSMRDLNIRRLGHVTHLPSFLRQRVLDGIYEDGGVGVEVCPTSNMVTKEISSLKEHHFLDWWKKSDKVLLSINTDDTGLFSCDLSSEVYDLAQAFGLSRADVIDIQRQAISSAFHPEKERLMTAFEKMLACAKEYDSKKRKLNGL